MWPPHMGRTSSGEKQRPETQQMQYVVVVRLAGRQRDAG